MKAQSLRILDDLNDVRPEDWNAVARPPGAPFDPFVTWEFLQALEQSGCASADTGWAPRHIVLLDAEDRPLAAAPLYLKAHSMGEYVFDHSWADALYRAGGRYYPKLQCASPFTPSPGRRLLVSERAGPDGQTLLLAGIFRLAEEEHASSFHATFCTQEQADWMESQGLMRRYGVQFHFHNSGYRDFEDFLAELPSLKRKNLRKERARAREGLEIRWLVGRDIAECDWDAFFHFYMDTGDRKWGRPYLNREFFSLLGERLGEHCLLMLACDGGRPIAGALHLIGSETLFGRYWGRIEDRPFLHFELCYYQAIDFALERKLARVEAGAQGEHKLARGYRPVLTHSVHWIAHRGLANAVGHFLEEERRAVLKEVDALQAATPFKHIPTD